MGSGDTTGLIIFDCDGVLVDSEPLSFDCLMDALHHHGWQLSREEAMARFLGKTVFAVRDGLAEAIGREPPADFVASLQQATLAHFRLHLQAMPGIKTLLAGLHMPVCVASSSTPERIHLSLQLTGLLDHFRGHIFSASEVPRGKPAPDLFLHASQQMGVAPDNCLVVEDSLSGIQAARAAGMQVLGFTGGGHLHHEQVAPAMGEAGALGVVEDFSQLTAWLTV